MHQNIAISELQQRIALYEDMKAYRQLYDLLFAGLHRFSNSMGFANEDFDEYVTPTLSSIDQQTVNMGREAFKMLLGLIEGGVAKIGLKHKIILDRIIFYRESSMRYGQRNSRFNNQWQDAGKKFKTKTTNIKKTNTYEGTLAKLVTF